MTTTLYILLALLLYFIVNSFLLALYVAQDRADDSPKALALALFLAVVTPVYTLIEFLKEKAKELDSLLQIRTFWYYVFNRSKLDRTTSQLWDLHTYTVTHKTSNSLAHKAWRAAEKVTWKANKYNGSQPSNHND
jgi:hypothetical protein